MPGKIRGNEQIGIFNKIIFGLKSGYCITDSILNYKDMHKQGWGKIYRCIVQGVSHKLTDTFLSPEAIKMLISGLGAAVAYQ